MRGLVMVLLLAAGCSEYNVTPETPLPDDNDLPDVTNPNGDDDDDAVGDDDDDAVGDDDDDAVGDDDDDAVGDDDDDAVGDDDDDAVGDDDDDAVGDDDDDAVGDDDDDAVGDDDDDAVGDDDDDAVGDDDDDTGDTGEPIDPPEIPIDPHLTDDERCEAASLTAGYLDPYQTPNDKKVWFCHYTGGGNWTFVNSSISSCVTHILNHGGDVFPTTGCDS